MKQDYSYSFDKDKNIIYIDDAAKGSEYFCPCCGKIMIPKQGKIRRWHFAHKGTLDNCSYETYLHKIAKIRIRKCFEDSSQFTISYYQTVLCNVPKCPIASQQPCSWKNLETFNLKDYYNKCEEEVSIGEFRADLMLTNTEKDDREPILIEIFVSHKSTEKKLQSKYKIIELRIESEDDINEIISNAKIVESKGYKDNWMLIPNDKVKFFNFKESSYGIPDIDHQAYKYRFWIDLNKYIRYYEPNEKCLTPTPPEIEKSIFRIESKYPIEWNFAMKTITQSGLNIKYCSMCYFYRTNSLCRKKICILYKKRGLKRFPLLSDAMNCPHFQQINYERSELGYTIRQSNECVIVIRQEYNK